MKESKLEEIELRDTQLQPFRHLLRYIYTGQMSLSNQKDEMILEILGLAHQYGFIDLETSISDYLRLTLLNIRNVSLIYDTASLYQLETLVNACCSFMDRNASDVIKHESLTSKLSTKINSVSPDHKTPVPNLSHNSKLKTFLVLHFSFDCKQFSSRNI